MNYEIMLFYSLTEPCSKNLFQSYFTFLGDMNETLEWVDHKLSHLFPLNFPVSFLSPPPEDKKRKDSTIDYSL